MNFSEMTRIITLEDPFMPRKHHRNFFSCLEINIPRNSDFMKEVKSKADEILPNLNRGGANSSEKRDEDVVYNDNFAGLVAEEVCKRLLNYRYGGGIVDLTAETRTTAKKQIDIKLCGGKTIEVRSSGIKNGLEFAIFKVDAHGNSYIDIIGQYSNHYKPGETVKDYYLRPIYTFDIGLFSKYLETTDVVTLYLIGGANARMMNDPRLYVEKSMRSDAQKKNITKPETRYRAIPIIKGLDICEFFQMFERENSLKVIHPFVTVSDQFKIQIHNDK